MKINTIYRSRNERRKETSDGQSIRKYTKNPESHPFLIQREYVRALNATKMDRIFAKPFVKALTHMGEGIMSLIKDYELPFFATTSYDYKATLWDMISKTAILTTTYQKPIASIALDNNQNIYVTQDNTVISNKNVYKCDRHINSIDFIHGSTDDLAVGTNDSVHIFDINRLTPKITYDAVDTTKVKFNVSFKHIFATINTSEVNLYDNRIGKVFSTINTPAMNCIDFNIQSGYILACGNEDGNSYMYDIRNIDTPTGIYRGHLNAVVSIAFHPNGKELVTGSFDKTIRIFDVNARKSRDCYYNSRMQILHGVTFSNDGRFIISGSDDGCLRLWKTNASKKIGPISKFEKSANSYKDALKNKYKNVENISRIEKHRFMPKELKELGKQSHEKHNASLRREENKKKTN